MENKITKEEYKELGEKFKKAWGNEVSAKSLDEIDKEFMEEIRNIMNYFAREPEENPMNGCYDGAMVLDSISKLITKFNDIYHFAYTTQGWADDK